MFSFSIYFLISILNVFSLARRSSTRRRIPLTFSEYIQVMIQIWRPVNTTREEELTTASNSQGATFAGNTLDTRVTLATQSTPNATTPSLTDQGFAKYMLIGSFAITPPALGYQEVCNVIRVLVIKYYYCLYLPSYHQLIIIVN